MPAPIEDHYKVLGLDQNCTEEDIRVSYRKVALKWHPDRNFGNVEEATAKFSQAQAAYEVLSDPNERAWYDKHKEAILRGGQDENGEYDSEVVGTTTAELLSMFNPSYAAQMNDSEKGFFTIYRKIFERLVSEEEEACKAQGLDFRTLPSFGGSHTSEDETSYFYSAWNGFSTNKSFYWAEVYEYSRAPDRRVRRAMEKENKKERENARREYNETIRNLLSFVKKRDYRFVAQAVSMAKKHEDMLKDRKEQAAKDRAARQAAMEEYVEQDWMKVSDQKYEEEMVNEADLNEIECVACSKTFKSEKAYASHEKSKKHIQTIKKLRWELEKEARALGLNGSSDDDHDDDDDDDDDNDNDNDIFVSADEDDCGTEDLLTHSSDEQDHIDLTGFVEIKDVKAGKPETKEVSHSSSEHTEVGSGSEDQLQADYVSQETFLSRVEKESVVHKPAPKKKKKKSNKIPKKRK